MTQAQAAAAPSINVAREASISAVASGIISFAFFVLVFRSVSPIPLGSGAAFPGDFLIQSFAVGLFAALVPVLIARVQIKKASGVSMPLGPLLLRALILAALSLCVFGLAAFAISSASAGALSWWLAAVIKVGFGALISLAVTPLALRPMIKTALST